MSKEARAGAAPAVVLAALQAQGIPGWARLVASGRHDSVRTVPQPCPCFQQKHDTVFTPLRQEGADGLP